MPIQVPRDRHADLIFAARRCSSPLLQRLGLTRCPRLTRGQNTAGRDRYAHGGGRLYPLTGAPCRAATGIVLMVPIRGTAQVLKT